MAVRLEHANLCVRDIDRMIGFLQTAFPEFRVRGEGTSNDGTRWVHIGTAETYIALGQSRLDPAEHWTPYQGLPGVNHLAYEVDDVEALRLRLLSAGDPEGNDWEFVQYLSQDPVERNDYRLPDR